MRASLSFYLFIYLFIYLLFFDASDVDDGGENVTFYCLKGTIIIIIIIIVLLWEFFSPTLADGFSLESKRQQVS